jgi:hypothetical protein
MRRRRLRKKTGAKRHHFISTSQLLNFLTSLFSPATGNWKPATEWPVAIVGTEFDVLKMYQAPYFLLLDVFFILG